MLARYGVYKELKRRTQYYPVYSAVAIFYSYFPVPNWLLDFLDIFFVQVIFEAHLVYCAYCVFPQTILNIFVNGVKCNTVCTKNASIQCYFLTFQEC